MSELMLTAVSNLSLAAPGKFPFGVHGDAEITDACRSVIGTLMDWLAEDATEVEIAAELLRQHAPDTDLTAARMAVRDVVDVLREILERDVGRLT